MAKMNKQQARLDPSTYLQKPYMRSVIPQEDGTYFAEIVEFPGCIATGNTVDEAYAELEEVAESWIEASLQAGRNIPNPLQEVEYSGKTVVRMPKSIHRKAALAAELDGVSLNQFIVNAVGIAIGQRQGANSIPPNNTFHIHMVPSSRGHIETRTNEGFVGPDRVRNLELMYA